MEILRGYEVVRDVAPRFSSAKIAALVFAVDGQRLEQFPAPGPQSGNVSRKILAESLLRDDGVYFEGNAVVLAPIADLEDLGKKQIIFLWITISTHCMGLR